MWTFLRIAACVGVMAYLSPEWDRAARPALPTPGPAEAQALLRALPDGVRERLAAEALRQSLRSVGREPDDTRPAR